ncbi:MAG: helix-turn-helix transcriptional regulator, partial [Rhizobiaceae bacterium]|nr:helix-turn-helix transcriptional regulator [Rhizobiaceae bacterium]
QIGRNHLLCRNTPPDRSSEIANLIQVSKRTVEQAFSSNVSVGPLTYSRILRLHQVRRKLMDPSMATLSIGDIAAEHGFWDWSRFSQHYRRQFGSLPSAARPDH